MEEYKLTNNEREEIIKIIMKTKKYTPTKGVILFKLYNQNNIKIKEMQVKGYKDYKFNNIDCMISEDGLELRFFKSCNDTRPSQATYIKLDDAKHLYNIFKTSYNASYTKLEGKDENKK